MDERRMKEGRFRAVYISTSLKGIIMQIKHLQIALAVMIVMVIVCGCSTERHITPTILEPPRTGLELTPPVLSAVFDGRATQHPKDAAQLQADLSRIYGTSIEWDGYFAKTPKGRVAVRIRIVMLGSSFGSPRTQQ